jgi:glycosyltransferase involved in cell wall biosynthesis
MKLSIITINRNNANGLKQTLKSVAEQTFKDFEHIVIDGASTDNSVSIIEDFQHIAYYISEPDNGIYDAMNKGTIQAKGEYCLFLNSGDYLTCQTVLEQVSFHLFNEDIVYGNLIKKNLKGEEKEEKVIESALSLEFFAVRNLPHQSSFIRTTLLKQLGFYRTDFQIVSDYVFLLEAILKHGASYKHIPIFVSVFIEDGVSSNPNNYTLIQKEREKALKELCRSYEHIYIYGTGICAEQAVDFFEKEKIAINGFIVSDGFKKENEFKNKAIYEFSQIKPDNGQIVVLALNGKNKEEVIPNLKKAKIQYFDFFLSSIYAATTNS